LEEHGNGERDAGEMLELFHSCDVVVAGAVGGESGCGDFADLGHEAGGEFFGCVAVSAIVHSCR
jgi:hypothetical protein